MGTEFIHYLHTNPNNTPWFKDVISAANSASTEMDQSWRLRSVSGDTRKALHKKLKKF